MPLTDIAVRQARPKDKNYTLSDGRGLGLCVTPSGGKNWYFRYSWLGKQQRMALGRYPEISLKEARVRREESRACVAQGIHPLKRRRQEVLVKRLAGDRQFQGVSVTGASSLAFCCRQQGQQRRYRIARQQPVHVGAVQALELLHQRCLCWAPGRRHG
ncbi:MAG: Arm DNA-binding domain-containing protein [Ottowia sp.]|uniref:Arm DNA-binding domain-containing protein n=1 Tax=Ottowia sp. TaxID=1898956 RepID=UPI0039E4813E